ncbi:transcriptional regulator [Streptomyces sp. NPDC087270]|uniref:transcriptional regulator n=1 Tax=Streptomyces sp. NPDC087270 TaxID=3365774 RepID=UPI00381E76C1
MDRRRFLGVVATATAGSGPLAEIAEARQGIDSALSGSDAGDLAYLEGAFERHRGGYRGRAPAMVLGQMRGDLDLLRAVLNRPHTAATRTHLARIAAGIVGLVAIIQHDRGDQREAHRWFTTAERAAQESGDRHMLAWALARHAMVPLNYGAPEAAADLARRAGAAAGRAPSASAALAAAVTARALASNGDRQGALREVAATRTIAEQLEGAETADTWFGYPMQKHHVHLSQAFTLLGNAQEAYDEQDAALGLTRAPSVMTRALLDIDRATCMSTEGDPAHAAEKAAGVWEALPTAYRGGLVRERISTLCDTIADTAPTVAQELRTALV